MPALWAVLLSQILGRRRCRLVTRSPFRFTAGNGRPPQSRPFRTLQSAEFRWNGSVAHGGQWRKMRCRTPVPGAQSPALRPLTHVRKEPGCTLTHRPSAMAAESGSRSTRTTCCRRTSAAERHGTLCGRIANRATFSGIAPPPSFSTLKLATGGPSWIRISGSCAPSSDDRKASGGSR